VARILTLFVITLAFYAQAPLTIEGVVRDSTTGVPMEGVTIYLSQGRIDSVFAMSDSQGKFTLETKETGRLRVYPSKNGYIYARPGQKRAPARPGVWVQLSVGDHVKGLELSMAKSAVISGRILDANGNPIAGTAGNVGLMRYTYRDDGNRELGWVPGIVFPGAAGSFVRMNDRGEFRLYEVLKPVARVSGSVLIEDETGHRLPAPRTIPCRIRSRYGSENCVGSQVVPGLHQFDLQGLPPDMYLQSAKIGDRDVLAGELNITSDTTLDIVLATPGAILDGIVRTADGNVLADSAVVLVPESPYDKVLARYRSVITDSNGKYEIHGVAPGSYKLYAWPELEGFAYRNAEFMKEFEGRGKIIRIEKKDHVSVDLTAL
jgi:hypothetical protein